LAGCGRHAKEAPKGGSDVPPSQAKIKRNVALTQVREEKLSSFVDTVGYLEAEGQTEIAAGVSGVVDEVLFREGQFVDRDTILIKVDQRRYLTAVEVAKANEARAIAAVNLNRELEVFALRSGSGTSPQDKVTVSGNLRVAEAELQSARAARAMAEHNLYRSQVRAPYAGQINQRRIAPGTYLEEKTVIGTIADLSKLRLVGWIPEKTTGMVREMIRQEEQRRVLWMLGGALQSPLTAATNAAVDHAALTPASYQIEFTLRAYPDRKFYGRVFYMSTVANPDTHMFECKAEVPTYNLHGVELKPGYTAKIRAPVPGRERSVVIPEEAVRASEHGFIVFLPRPETKDGQVVGDRDGRGNWIAQERVLELGQRFGGKVEVLKGLTLDDVIVHMGAETLENNTPIRFPEEQEKWLKVER
jgi:multidrug efflux system membrane fusion protein